MDWLISIVAVIVYFFAHVVFWIGVIALVSFAAGDNNHYYDETSVDNSTDGNEYYDV